MTAKKPKTAAIILVPVDFSGHSRAALMWACEQARWLHATIVVLHVVHDLAHSPGYYKLAPSDLMRPMEDVAAKMMRRFLKGVGKAYGKKVGGRKDFKKRLTTKLVVGLPVTRILEVADKIGAGHIVMGSQGRTGLARLLLGSKAEQIVRIAPMPVTIVKVPGK